MISNMSTIISCEAQEVTVFENAILVVCYGVAASYGHEGT
jgi:hypothetical protein